MSTQTTAGAGPLTVVAADTLIENTGTQSVKALLPMGSDMTDGDEIRFRCTGGGNIVIETERGHKVGIVPGDGQAVAVYEAGPTGEVDFWRFMLVAGPFSPFVSKTSHVDSATATALVGAAQAAATGAANAAVTGLVGPAPTGIALVDELLDPGALAIDATIEKYKTGNEVIVRIAGVQKNQAAATAQVFSAADTINTAAGAGLLWGIWLIQMDVAGVFTTKSPSSDQVHVDEATAIAALPAADAGKVGIGRITVEAKTGAAWTAITDALDGTDTNAVNFVDFAATDLVQVQIDALVADLAALIVEYDKAVADIALILAQADKSTIDIAAMIVEDDLDQADLAALVVKFDANVALVNTAGAGGNAGLVALIDQGLMLAE